MTGGKAEDCCQCCLAFNFTVLFSFLEQVLQNFSQQSGAWHHCIYFMNNCSNQYVLMYAVSVFEVSKIAGFHVTSLCSKFKNYHPSEVLVSLDTRSTKTLTFHSQCFSWTRFFIL